MLESTSKMFRIQTQTLKKLHKDLISKSPLVTIALYETWETWLLAPCKHIQAYDNLCWCRCVLDLTSQPLCHFCTEFPLQFRIKPEWLPELWWIGPSDIFILTMDQISKSNVKNVAVTVTNPTYFFPMGATFRSLLQFAYLLFGFKLSLTTFISVVSISSRELFSAKKLW